MEQSVKEVLEEAVQRYCNGDKQSDDIILATVSSAITVDCLRQGDEVELSQFQLSNPPISWTVKLKVRKYFQCCVLMFILVGTLDGL